MKYGILEAFRSAILCCYFKRLSGFMYGTCCIAAILDAVGYGTHVVPFKYVVLASQPSQIFLTKLKNILLGVYLQLTH